MKLTLIGAVAGVALLAAAGCGDVSTGKAVETPASPQGPQMWASAPKDGTWEDASKEDVSFGTISSRANRLSDYVFGIKKAPTLTTDDDAETATIVSQLTVKRVSDKWPGESVEDDLNVWWEPGERLPEHSMDESWGTHPDVSCAPQTLTTGGTALCRLAFTAPAAEISNSYWQVEGDRIGTWPSQKTG